VEVFFLPAQVGVRFCVHHVPAKGSKTGQAIVFVPAFAEEMNKSRHVVAQTARRICEQGVGVLLIDLYGCGDSSGHFEDATWETWRADVALATRWLQDYGYSRLMIWGMRLGGLLAAACAVDSPAVYERCILWQPVISGDSYLTQFLRLRVANALLSGAPAGTSVGQLRSRLLAGDEVDVAGYRLGAALATGFMQHTLLQARPLCPIEWFEVVADRGRAPAPLISRLAEEWRAGGSALGLTTVEGESFWAAANAAELVQCLALVEATALAARSWT